MSNKSRREGKQVIGHLDYRLVAAVKGHMILQAQHEKVVQELKTIEAELLKIQGAIGMCLDMCGFDTPESKQAAVEEAQARIRAELEKMQKGQSGEEIAAIPAPLAIVPPENQVSGTELPEGSSPPEGAPDGKTDQP